MLDTNYSRKAFSNAIFVTKTFYEKWILPVFLIIICRLHIKPNFSSIVFKAQKIKNETIRIEKNVGNFDY